MKLRLAMVIAGGVVTGGLVTGGVVTGGVVTGGVVTGGVVTGGVVTGGVVTGGVVTGGVVTGGVVTGGEVTAGGESDATGAVLVVELDEPPPQADTIASSRQAACNRNEKTLIMMASRVPVSKDI